MGIASTSSSLQKDSDNCVLFPVPVPVNGRVFHSQPITVDLASPGHVVIQYSGNGTLQCQGKKIVYGKSRDDCDVWASGCDWLELMPNENNCYIECSCSNSTCQYNAIVTDKSYSNQWSFCSIDLG